MTGISDATTALEGLACACDDQVPVRIVTGSLSLLMCETCDGLVLTRRPPGRPDELDELRREVEGLRLIADVLRQEASLLAAAPEPRPAGRAHLRLLRGGLAGQDLLPAAD